MTDLMSENENQPASESRSATPQAASTAPAAAAAPSRTSRPEASADHRTEFVVACGSFTTMIALAAVYALARSGTNIMGWYANFILPAGAMLVGAVAASGYGVAAWGLGLKMSKKLIWSVVGQLALAYLIAQYEQFSRVVREGSGIGFFEWFDAMTRSFAWDNHGHPGEPFGIWGYAMRVLEVAGFVAGGALVPLVLKTKPYCDPCRSYLRTRSLGVTPAGVNVSVLGRYDKAEAQQAYQAAVERVNGFLEAVREGRRDQMRSFLDTHAPQRESRAAHKKSARMVLNLARCPRCADGFVSVIRMQGQGNNISQAEIARQPLSGERVQALFD